MTRGIFSEWCRRNYRGQSGKERRHNHATEAERSLFMPSHNRQDEYNTLLNVHQVGHLARGGGASARQIWLPRLSNCLHPPTSLYYVRQVPTAEVVPVWWSEKLFEGQKVSLLYKVDTTSEVVFAISIFTKSVEDRIFDSKKWCDVRTWIFLTLCNSNHGMLYHCLYRL